MFPEKAETSNHWNVAFRIPSHRSAVPGETPISPPELAAVQLLAGERRVEPVLLGGRLEGLPEGEAVEVEEGCAAREALGDGGESAPLLRPGEDVAPRAPVPVDAPFERGEKLGLVLQLVEDEGRPVVVEEELRVAADFLHVDDGVEDDEVGRIAQSMSKERALAHLPRNADDDGGKLFMSAERRSSAFRGRNMPCGLIVTRRSYKEFGPPSGRARFLWSRSRPGPARRAGKRRCGPRRPCSGKGSRAYSVGSAFALLPSATHRAYVSSAKPAGKARSSGTS